MAKVYMDSVVTRAVLEDVGRETVEGCLKSRCLRDAMRFGVPLSETLRVVELPRWESDRTDEIRLRTLCRVRVEGL